MTLVCQNNKGGKVIFKDLICLKDEEIMVRAYTDKKNIKNLVQHVQDAVGVVLLDKLKSKITGVVEMIESEHEECVDIFIFTEDNRVHHLQGRPVVEDPIYLDGKFLGN